MRCLFFFCRPIRGISPGESSRRLASLGSHLPLGDRRAACAARHSPGGERANSRQRRDSRVFGCFRAQSARLGSHIPPEDRGACSPGAGRGYSRRRRNSRTFINVPWASNSAPQFKPQPQSPPNDLTKICVYSIMKVPNRCT